MISRISGILIEKSPPTLVVEVGGMAYEIEVPMSTIYDLPNIGEGVTLHTHLLVREDAHLLYGFGKPEEKIAFRQLLKVNGIGAKIALAILSALSLDELRGLVASEDAARLTKVPGIGRKTAERLILELRDKLSHPDGSVSSAPKPSLLEDAISALVSLGYSERDARTSVSKVEDGLTLPEIIRQTLQLISSK
ncbi:MAG: Holliday junction branch migration protein RuvA [Proteobacteria bacterium]|nr:Holliday junction branch migration protein RuvA [Pseudomonadota bacterium]MDA0862473.1 Holliday junction branch migration protein RuvA [Pseudomonadota bacterium]MDA1031369.1 Holliday junction branch migration protein RuvA [Pseudomonadota bacterium]